MCGILALVAQKNKKLPIEQLNLALQKLTHRGPDSLGGFHNETVYIGATRLAHRDLSSLANLPMIDHESGNALAFNGELVNDRTLRSDLINLGIIFQTQSDSEVILKGYQAWGTEIFSKIRGMFAVVLWDERKQKMIVARDWYGVKPLFYSKTNIGFLFSSEMRSVSPFLRVTLNEKRLSEYLTFGHVAHPETLINEIFHFPKGHITEVDLEMESLTFQKIVPSPNVESLADIISRNIVGYSKSDREIGLQLSGGIDSTFVLKHASPFLNEKLSFGVNVPDSINSELEYQNLASHAYKTKHFVLEAHNELFLENLLQTTKALEIPIHHHANVYLYLLMEQASKLCRGLLTGEGGDEFFMGYPRYQIDPLRIEKIFLENKDTPSRMQKAHPLLRQLYLSPERIERLAPDLVKHYPERTNLLFNNDGTKFINNLILHDQNFGLDSLLLRQDRLGMHFSLENRPPLIDPDIQSLINQMAKENLVGKKILKCDLLPEMGNDFVNRKKKGFGIPIFDILNTPAGKNIIEEKVLQSIQLKNYITQKGIYFEINRFNHKDIESSKYLMRLIYLDTYLQEVFKPYQESFNAIE